MFSLEPQGGSHRRYSQQIQGVPLGACRGPRIQGLLSGQGSSWGLQGSRGSKESKDPGSSRGPRMQGLPLTKDLKGLPKSKYPRASGFSKDPGDLRDYRESKDQGVHKSRGS